MPYSRNRDNLSAFHCCKLKVIVFNFCLVFLDTAGEGKQGQEIKNVNRQSKTGFYPLFFC